MQDIYTSKFAVPGYFLDTRKPVDEDCIAFLSRETLRGISYMHSQGKIHRDIKVFFTLTVPDILSHLN